MEDMSRNNAIEICKMIEERGASDVIGLDLGSSCSWASQLLVGTVTSRVHMQGLTVAVKAKMTELGMITKSGGKKSDESSWRIVDGGDVVVSLMDSEARDYYALEERWFEAELIFGEDRSQSSSSS